MCNANAKCVSSTCKADGEELLRTLNLGMLLSPVPKEGSMDLRPSVNEIGVDAV